MNFNDLNINEKIINGLKNQNIENPTKVQSLSIPKILENKDLIVNSETGSGKTLSFLIPSFERIDTSKRETQVLILAPTHELVMQINEQIKLLAINSEIDVTSFTLIGEVNIQKQIKNIKNIKPHIVVGTSGRVLDLIKQKKLKAHTIKTIILDEVDSLLSKNNSQNILNIVKSTLKERQVIAFSASVSDDLILTCKSFMKIPETLKLVTDAKINSNIEHFYLHCDRREKFTNLRKLLASIKPEKAIVFVNDEGSLEVITEKLNHHKYKACTIFGNMKKEDRKNALESFRNGKNNILVSSDLSSRGLDVVDVSHVFNLDFPNSKNEYIHRSGRSSRRKDKKGYSISIVTNQNLRTIREYQANFKIKMREIEVKEGEIYEVNKIVNKKPTKKTSSDKLENKSTKSFKTSNVKYNKNK